MKGGPKSSTNWLKTHLSNHDLKMTADNIILGGTALGLHKVQPGDCVEVKVDGKIAVQCFHQSKYYRLIYRTAFLCTRHHNLSLFCSYFFIQCHTTGIK